MAKGKVVHQAASMSVPVGLLYWDESRNFSREKPSTQRPVLVKLLTNGWNFVLGAIPVERIEVVSERDKKDYSEIRVKELQGLWELYKKDHSPLGLTKLSVFEEMHIKDGKVLKPQFMPNACFQRGMCYFDAMVRCRTLEGKGEKEDGTDGVLRLLVPIMERSYESEAERLREQVQENELKSEGAQPISDRDRLRSARVFVQLGKNQKFLRDTFRDTTGQKLWAVNRIDIEYPNSHIFDRCLADESSADYVPYSKLRTNDLNKILRQRKQVTCNPGEVEMSDEDLNVWLNNVRHQTGSGQTGQIMKKEEIVNMVGSNPVQIIKDCMDAVASNNSDKIAHYMPLSVGLNALAELAKMGLYPPAESWLVETLQNAKAEAERRKLAQE